MSKMSAQPTKIAVIYYSLYGHVAKMAERVKAGIDAVEGVEGHLFQVKETLSDEILEKMHAPPKNPDVPVISATELNDYDGYMFGIPTRFGMMPAQLKALFDATGGQWAQGKLIGRPAGLFVSVGTQGGGMETTALTTLTQLTHHGMIFVPPGYSFGAPLYDNSTVRGGSAWGAGTFAGADGQRQPSDVELEFAQHQGKYFAEVAKKLTVK